MLKKNKRLSTFTGKTYAIVKSSEINFGYEAVELTIIDGEVVAEKVLTRAPQLPAHAQARAEYSMYQNRDQPHKVSR